MSLLWLRIKKICPAVLPMAPNLIAPPSCDKNVIYEILKQAALTDFLAINDKGMFCILVEPFVGIRSEVFNPRVDLICKILYPRIKISLWDRAVVSAFEGKPEAADVIFGAFSFNLLFLETKQIVGVRIIIKTSGSLKCLLVEQKGS